MKLFAKLFGPRNRSSASATDPEAPEASVPKNSASNASDAKRRRPIVRRLKARVLGKEGSYPMEVVGESKFQENLISLCGGYSRDGYDARFEAVIEREPLNPHDEHAVVVRIHEKVVGYLPRAQASRVSAQMDREGIQAAACSAAVRGGWRTNQYDKGSFGVRLSIPQRGWIDFGIGAEPISRTRKKTAP